MSRLTTLVISLLLLFPAAAWSQSGARASDVSSPEALVDALYASVTRRPGEHFDWARARNLYLPSARLIPNLAQTGGQSKVLTVDDFIGWVDANTSVGGPDDKGFEERQIAVAMEQFGDIAHAFSTYEKGYHGLTEVLGRGINSIQMVRRAGRWWVTQIVWDEASGTQTIPPRYSPDG